MNETDLYPPIKRFLEAQGYVVKAEVKSCDVVAQRGDEPPVIVELKTGLTLQLIYQAIDRLSLTDDVYIAIARPKRGVPSEALKLLKRIGVGLLVVTSAGSVEAVVHPEPYRPRKNPKRSADLIKEFTRRKGDPNIGGSTRTKLMTAYKQDAILCLQFLCSHGPTRVKDIRGATKVDRTANILRDDYYGWFMRVDRGVYALTELGQSEAKALASPKL